MSDPVGLSLSNLVSGRFLLSSSGGGLGACLGLAMWLQMTIIQTAAGLVDRQATTRLPHFRYAYILLIMSSTGSGGVPGGAVTQPGGQRSDTTRSALPHARTFYAPCDAVVVVVALVVVV